MNDINHWVEEFEDNMQDYEIFIFHLQQKVVNRYSLLVIG